jgi:hypothetical protein
MCGLFGSSWAMCRWTLDTTKIYLRLVPGRLKEDYDRAMPEIAVNVVDHVRPYTAGPSPAHPSH